jgi:hypothetical protein
MICRRRATEMFGQSMSIAAPVTLLNVHADLYTGLVLVRLTMILTTAVGESLDPPRGRAYYSLKTILNVNAFTYAAGFHGHYARR